MGATEREIRLPSPPLVAVSAFNVYDDSDVAVLFATTNYYVDKADARRRGRVVLRRGSVWLPVLRVANGIEITFTCGYGTGGPVLPYQLKQGMLLLLQYAFRNRGESMKLEDMLSVSGAAMLLTDYQDLDR